MVYVNSLVNIIDNSGGLTAKCLKILTKSPKSKGIIGDLVLIVIKTYKPNKKVKKGLIYKAIIIRSSVQLFRYGGVYIKFSKNAVILLNSRLLPMGTRILSVINLELRHTAYFKFTSLASYVV